MREETIKLLQKIIETYEEKKCKLEEECKKTDKYDDIIEDYKLQLINISEIKI